MKKIILLYLAVITVFYSFTQLSSYGKVDIQYPQGSRIGTAKYPYLVKEFRNIISTNNLFYSLVFAPTPYSSVQRAQSGTFLIATDNKTGLTNALDTRYTNSLVNYAEPQIDNDVNYNTYNINNNIAQLNILYSERKDNKGLYFYETTIDDQTGVTNKQFSVPLQFELTSNGSVETFSIDYYGHGNGIAAFTAHSTFNSKSYLFVCDYRLQLPTSLTQKIDLTALSPDFVNSNNQIYYWHNKQGAMLPVQLDYVVKGHGYTYLFLYFPQIDNVIPIKINNQSKTISLMTASTMKIHEEEKTKDGIFYMPCSYGFVNYYWNIENGSKELYLNYYDKELTSVWQMTLKDIQINHVYESGRYIIVGGYTNTKGYLGYPNPRIIVIDKKTKVITFDKVIARKDADVDYITSNYSGGIIFGIGGTDKDDINFVPQIITDKLDSTGVFEDNIFDK